MNVLIIKTSSLGDLIHTFPALTDAQFSVKSVQFDWVVEESFSEVPLWHPSVNEVIPIAIRRWRKNWRQTLRLKSIGQFKENLRKKRYDLIIDAQGLVKSAIPARWALGPISGFDRKSAKEPLASFFYHKAYKVEFDQHAIRRNRILFAKSLGYDFTEKEVDFGLNWRATRKTDVMLLHVTSLASKQWPDLYWAELAHYIKQDGFEPLLPWHTAEERLRADRIRKMANCGKTLPRLTLNEIASRITGCGGVVGVDTGLSHIAAAVKTPMVMLFGPTNIELTGAVGDSVINLNFEEINPLSVWTNLKKKMEHA
tara:strand:+ start:5777 stop:6712 length:936 start_codon:yes stop_codon:yes gene_type:complete